MGTRICPKCSIPKTISEFYSRRNKPGSSPYCKSCTTSNKQFLKSQAVQFKGGKCKSEMCGYNDWIGSLDFYPLDHKKKLQFSRYSTFEKLQPELEKYTLLCRNCSKKLQDLHKQGII